MEHHTLIEGVFQKIPMKTFILQIRDLYKVLQRKETSEIELKIWKETNVHNNDISDKLSPWGCITTHIYRAVALPVTDHYTFKFEVFSLGFVTGSKIILNLSYLCVISILNFNRSVLKMERVFKSAQKFTKIRTYAGGCVRNFQPTVPETECHLVISWIKLTLSSCKSWQENLLV